MAPQAEIHLLSPTLEECEEISVQIECLEIALTPPLRHECRYIRMKNALCSAFRVELLDALNLNPAACSTGQEALRTTHDRLERRLMVALLPGLVARLPQQQFHSGPPQTGKPIFL